MTRAAFISFLETVFDLDTGELSEESELQDSGYMNSLAVISIIAKVNEVFDRELNLLEMKNVSTVGELLDCIGADSFQE